VRVAQRGCSLSVKNNNNSSLEGLHIR